MNNTTCKTDKSFALNVKDMDIMLMCVLPDLKLIKQVLMQLDSYSLILISMVMLEIIQVGLLLIF